VIHKVAIIGIMIMLVVIFNACTKQSDFPELKGPYLGQKPPGMTWEIFASGIISTEHKEHSTLAFSPKGTEIFWSIWPMLRLANIPQVIKFIKMENGR